eukprot:GEMP01006811.1.p1 GENE.GEMP01006811.1~~GEMP01006811.1.p1  ORF type:complete len:412 (+),score=47.72 GEMP01006811.1:233-1468(+)
MDFSGYPARAFSDLPIAAFSPCGADPLNFQESSKSPTTPNSPKCKGRFNMMATRGRIESGMLSPTSSPIRRRISMCLPTEKSTHVSPCSVADQRLSDLTERSSRLCISLLPDPAMLRYRNSSTTQIASPTYYHDSTPSVLFYPTDQEMGIYTQSPCQWPNYIERPSHVERPSYVSTRSGANGFYDTFALNYLSPRCRVADLADPVHIIPSGCASSVCRGLAKDDQTQTDCVPISVLSRSNSTSSGNSSSVNQVETTLMLRNLPNKYTRDMVLAEIEERGLKHDIDFFYLPIDLRHRCNVGYCFVNTVSTAAANRFHAAFQGAKLSQVKSGKTCEVSGGKVQGLDANIEAYRNSAVISMSEKYHPLLFVDGQPRPFPPPTLSREQLRQLKPEKKGVSTRVIKPHRTLKNQNN